MSATTHDHAHDHHDHKPSFFVRWLCSTNHKDIGTLYICFAVIGGLVGGILSEVMRAQLVRLIEATREPNITLQVVPFRSGGHAAEAGAFTIMRFPEPDLPDVVYLEQLTSALYLDKRDDVERYTEVMERLSVESESPERSAGILSGMLEEVEGI